jgi:hypothetical protein
MGKRPMAQKAMVVALVAAMSAGFGVATAMAQSSSAGTHTTLTAETREVSGRTVATFTAAVTGSESVATGAVTLMERGKAIASAALTSDGTAEITLDGLAAGDHSLQAVYSGDSAHASSASESVALDTTTISTPDFALAIAPASMTIAAPGDSGSLVATITPSNGFTGFISLSCSGPATSGSLPVGVSCTFTPANLQVAAATTANPTGAVSANLELITSAGQQVSVRPSGKTPNVRHGVEGPLALAVLLPGVVGLGFLARKRKQLGSNNFLSSASLLLLVGVVFAVGTTGCAARYKYLNHGPTYGGTAVGSYTITVTAQTSNGVTATAHSTTLALTVN